MQNISFYCMILGSTLWFNSLNAQTYCPGEISDPSVKWEDSALVLTWRLDLAESDANIQKVYYRCNMQDNWIPVLNEPQGKTMILSLDYEEICSEVIYWLVVCGNTRRWFDAEGVTKTNRKLRKL